MTNVEALERLARGEDASNLALRNGLLEMIALYRFLQGNYLELLRKADGGIGTDDYSRLSAAARDEVREWRGEYWQP